MANPIVGITVKYRNPNTGTWNTLTGDTSLSYTLTRNTEPSNATIRVKNVLHENNPINIGAEVEIYRYLNKASSYTPTISDLKFEGYVIPDSVGINNTGDYINLNVIHRKAAFNFNTFYGNYRGLIYTTGSGYGFINTSNVKTIASDIVANNVTIPTWSSTGTLKNLSFLQSKPASFSCPVYNTEIQDEPCGEALNNLMSIAGDFFWNFERRGSSGIPYFAIYKSSSGTISTLRQQQSGHSIDEADILSLDYKQDATAIVNRYKVFIGATSVNLKTQTTGSAITEYLDLSNVGGYAINAWDTVKETQLKDGTIHLPESGWCSYHSKVESGMESSGYADVYRLYKKATPIELYRSTFTSGLQKLVNVELVASSGVNSGCNWIEKRKFSGVGANSTSWIPTQPVNATVNAPFSPQISTQQVTTGIGTQGMDIYIKMSERNIIWTPYNQQALLQQIHTATGANPFFEGDFSVRLKLTYERCASGNVASGYTVTMPAGDFSNYYTAFYVGKGCSGVVNLGYGWYGEIESTTSAGFVSDYPYTITKPFYVRSIDTVEELDNVITQLKNKLAVNGNVKKSATLRCVVNSATDALTLANRVNISGSIGNVYKNANGFPMNIEQITFNYSPTDISFTFGLNKVNRVIPLPYNVPIVGYN